MKWIKTTLVVSVAVVTVLIGIFASRAEPLLRYKLEKNVQLAYEIDFNSVGEGRMGILSSPGGKTTGFDQHAKAELKGEIIYLPVALLTEGNWRVDFAITPETFSYFFNNQEVAKKPRAIRGSFNINDRGHIGAIYMESTDYDLYGNFIREILSSLELPLPDTVSQTWKGEETTLLDTIQTEFEIEDTNFFRTNFLISKSYKERAQIKGVTGSFNFVFDNKNGIVEKVTGNRRRVSKFGQQVMSDSTSTLVMRYTGKKAVADSELSKLSFDITKDSVVKDSLAGEIVARELRRRQYLSVLDSETFPIVLKSLKNVDVSDHTEVTKVGQKISALLYLDPKRAEEFGQLLDGYAFDDARRLTILAALSDNGSPEAQAALINAFGRSEHGSRSQVGMLFNIAIVDEPTPETETFFRELTESSNNTDIKTKAYFSLGIIAGNLRVNEHERTMRIFQEVKTKLETASTNDDKIVLIKTIGNMGLPEQVETLKPLLKDPNTEYKVEAINALRLVDTSEAKQLVLDFATDSDERTRETAVASLGFTPGNREELEVYKTQLFKETNLGVLKLILANTAKMIPIYSEATVILDEFIRQCAHRDICGYAESLRSTYVR